MAPNLLQLNQNLVNQVPSERVIRKRFPKELFLNILTLALAVLTSYFYKLYLDEILSIGFTMLALTGFIVCSILETLFIKDLARHALFNLLEVVGLLSLFIGTAIPLGTLGIAMGAGYFFFMWGEFSAHAEMKASFKVRFYAVARQHVGKALTAILIMGILLYAPNQNANKLFLSESAYQKLFGLSVDVVQTVYPEINVQSDVQHFSESVALLQLKKNAVYAQLPVEQKATTLTSTVEQFIVSLRTMLGISFNSSDNLGLITYRFAVNKISTWQKELGSKFTVFWAVLVFFLIRGLGSIFGIIVISLAYLIYELLLTMQVVVIRGESRIQEVAELS